LHNITLHSGPSIDSRNLEENNLRDKGENNLKEKEEINSTVEREENNSKDRVEMAGDENVLAKNHARFFKFNTSNVEWKDCGTGEVELLQHKETKKARVLMRRNKTLAIFANHYITSDMTLLPNVGSDRAWVWRAVINTLDGEPVTENFAVRFANKDIADEYKRAFENIQASAGAYQRVEGDKHPQNLS
ncbi:hypothetical protein FRC07_012636, partial [Ceratobasidium sp. 392]